MTPLVCIKEDNHLTLGKIYYNRALDANGYYLIRTDSSINDLLYSKPNGVSCHFITLREYNLTLLDL